jgi:hypothetical protein
LLSVAAPQKPGVERISACLAAAPARMVPSWLYMSWPGHAVWLTSRWPTMAGRPSNGMLTSQPWSCSFQPMIWPNDDSMAPVGPCESNSPRPTMPLDW